MADRGTIGTDYGPVLLAPDVYSTGRKVLRGIYGVDDNFGRMACGAMDSNVGNLAVPSLRMDAKGIFSFPWAVDNRQRTLSVYVKQAANVSPRPQMSILANSAISVSAASAVAGSSTGFVQLSLTFTPSGTGVITVQLEARVDCQNAFDVGDYRCYWDDFDEVLV